MNKPKPYTYWIFCDESGNLATEADRYLIGSAVGTSNPETLIKAVEYTRREFLVKQGRRKKKGQGKKKTRDITTQSYLHATDLDDRIVIDLLQRIAKIDDLTLHVVILDRYFIWNRALLQDLKERRDLLQNDLFTQLIKLAIPDVTMQSLVVLERRDNPKTYRDDLIAKITKATALDASQIEICNKDDNRWGRPLQIADFIAWSTYQKYKNQDDSFFQIFRDQVLSEVVLGVNSQGLLQPVGEMGNKKESG